ncbi:MAG: MaoC family dehydratase [Candidatus Tectomicrobia bacterium]|nr:MaoC family dehydratase [Candidatus Tectomicrobia bacterium]
MIKDLIYDEIKVGEELEPAEYTISEKEVKEYADKLDEHHPWHLHDSPFGGKIAHPLMTAVDATKLLRTKYSLAGVVHTKSECEFINPARVGQPIRVTGKIVDKYQRRGRDFIVVDSVTSHTDGTEIVKSKYTLMLRNVPLKA